MPKVSFVVPVFNAAPCLGWCINSILNQTIRDIELILVNDGSTDDSLTICRNYEMLDNRVQVLDIPNGGVSNARNIGVAKATGEYLQFVDADDVIAPIMTQQLLISMENYAADIVFCGLRVVKDYTKKSIESFDLNTACFGSECVMDKDAFFEKFAYILWESSTLEGPCNRMYKTNLIQKHHITFPKEMCYGEDFIFNLEYYALCSRVVFLSECYYFYLWHTENSLARKYKEGMFENQMRQFYALNNLLEDRKAMNEQTEFYLSNYLASQVISSLKMLFHADCIHEERKHKKCIAQMVNNADVRKAFPKATYIDARYLPLSDFILNCDVQGVLNFCARVEQQKDMIEQPAPKPGVLCRGFIGMCIFLQKLFKKGFINQWAHITELNLKTVGIKTTMSRIFKKLRNRVKRFK